jgi:hypothetical protein
LWCKMDVSISTMNDAWLRLVAPAFL